MAANLTTTISRFNPDRIMIAGILLMLGALVVGIVAWIVVDGMFTNYPYLFVVPWALALGVVMAVPSLVLYYRGAFSFADPLIFATWAYFFPAFVIGAIFFAVGLHDPYYIVFVQDAHSTLPYTLCLIALGFAGLSLGYFLPLAERVGAIVAKSLPTIDHTPSSLTAPGTVLLLVGVFNTVAAFLIGLFGYQKAADFTSYDGLINMTTFFWIQASFLLWLIIFRIKKITLIYYPIIAILVGTSLTKIAFSGSRGMIVQIFLIVLLAYILARRQFKLKHTAIAGVVFSLLLLTGMIYGSTFRNVKQTESQQSAGQYTENILLTFEQIGSDDSLDSLAGGFSSLAGRIDVMTTLAVVVSNYEQLAPYEEAYGLNGNIWTDSTTFFIPRVFWEDKPYASDPRKYSDLYFNFGESSFAITPMGDLLRNYGLPGIFIGLFVLGAILRFLYRALIDGQPFVFWRATLYFAIMTTISYEGFYGSIIPNMFKVGFFAIIGILFVGVFATRTTIGKPAV